MALRIPPAGRDAYAVGLFYALFATTLPAWPQPAARS
ncbi:hypothetical protein WG78_20220 [Amantichitinum ursilacus]|uniref:Uncharacterized protein n=1 Tax=Amantichitinum ursilacus TaxID=857265 RepID=A0A0N0GLB8_9NEIS|nr:hypothetical protein WG78_20220 [Amantichitinum ursilacus]